MLDIALSSEAPWPDHDWEQLANRAARAAIGLTTHGELLTSTAAVEILPRDAVGTRRTQRPGVAR